MEKTVTEIDSSDDREENQRFSSSLTTIHRESLARLFPPSMITVASDDNVRQLRQERNRLRKRRIFLFSEMQRKRAISQSSTVALDLTGIGDERPFVRSHGGPLPLQVGETKVPTQPYRNLAPEMKSIRARRSAVGAHCVSGVSLLPRTSDTLGVRIDICVKGRYVAGHVAFFRVVSSNKKRMLRIVQHTLPKGVLTNSELSVVLPNDGEAFARTLQERVGFIYDACHAHLHRRAACVWLQAQKYQDRCIQNVTFQDAYDVVSFQIVLHSRQDLPYKISLHYKNRFRFTPTEVSIQRMKPHSSKTEHETLYNPVAVHGDDSDSVLEEEDSPGIDPRQLEDLMRSFIREPITVSVAAAWTILQSVTH